MSKNKIGSQIDWFSVIIPLFIIIMLSCIFFILPDQSKEVLQTIREFLGNNFGIYYTLLGIGIFICTLYIALSKYGTIKLGNTEKPQYTSFQWGTMIFTSTMAADIVFYSFCEWIMYANEPYLETTESIQKWAPTCSLFHWGPIAWGFYIILSVAFGFMLHVQKRNRQKFSEACRPIFKDKIDGIIGKIIDLVAICALLAGTATTFSLATPLVTAALSTIFNIPNNTNTTLLVLFLIALVYILTIEFGMKGVAKLAVYCTNLFLILLLYFLICGGETRYILETGLSSIGNMIQNFIGLATWMDPLREDYFPQNWTIYYWAYWMVWCVATPFFIGSISKGRTIKEVILGGYLWGIAGTYISFIILGNYGLAQQLKYNLDIIGFTAHGGSYAEAILQIFNTMPFNKLGLFLLVITMITFYATTFDSITMVISAYSYKKLDIDMEPDKKIKTFWSILFIIFPASLIFSQNSVYSLQSLAIITALPIGIIILIIIISFFKSAKKYLTDTYLK